MTQQPVLTKPSRPSPVKSMLIGGGIALVVIVFFLVSAGTPDPAWGWGRFYWVKPVIVTPLVGALGGLFYHRMGRLRSRGGWRKALGYVVGIFGYIIALWMGTVLGLDGTYWN